MQRRHQATARLGRVDILGALVGIQGRCSVAAERHSAGGGHIGLRQGQSQLSQFHRLAGSKACVQGIAQPNFGHLHAISRGGIAQVCQNQFVVLEALGVGESNSVAGFAVCAQACLAIGNGCPSGIGPAKLKVRPQQFIAHGIAIGSVVACGQSQRVHHRGTGERHQQARIQLVAVEVLAVVAAIDRLLDAFTARGDGARRSHCRHHDRALLCVHQLVVHEALAVRKCHMARDASRVGQSGGARRHKRPARRIPAEVIVRAQQGITRWVTLGRIGVRSEIEAAQHVRLLQVEQQARRGRLDVHEFDIGICR